MKNKDVLGFETLENKSVLSSIVGILDSGLDINHKDLIDNLWTNPYEIANDNIDNDKNGYIDDMHGWNFVSNNNNVLDVYGHGTHVGGIVQGVNPAVKIVVLKMISDTGSGVTSALLNALDYIHTLKTQGIEINTVNASWTLGSYGSSVIKDKLSVLNNDGVVFVCAAGNNGSNIDIYPNYPSSFKLANIISVASITPDHILSGSSNYGVNTVQVAAYGTLINSTWPGNRYATLSGTSMAAPVVAGKISLLNGNASERIFALLSEVIKTDYLSSKVSGGGYLKDSWSALGSYTEVIKNEMPEVISGRVGIMNLNRVYGWAHSSTLGEKPMLVKVMINNRLVSTRWANLYRPDLINSVGSDYHGFDIKLNRYMFRRGWNTVRVYAVNTQNGSMKLLGSGSVRRWI
jgi:hypothetical protein